MYKFWKAASLLAARYERIASLLRGPASLEPSPVPSLRINGPCPMRNDDSQILCDQPITKKANMRLIERRSVNMASPCQITDH